MTKVFRLPIQAKTILICVAAVISLFKLVDWGAELLWFDALGYDGVFWRIRGLKVGLLLLSFTALYSYFLVNFRIASSRIDIKTLVIAPKTKTSDQSQTGRPKANLPSDQQGTNLRTYIRTPDVLTLIAIVIALLFGLVFYMEWDTLLRYLWSAEYGKSDPIFGRDIGFYLFQLPFLELLQNSLLAASMLASFLLIFGYYLSENFRVSWTEGIDAPAQVQRHISVNLTLVSAALTWGFYLDRYELLQSTRGAVYGAGYTDAYVTLPAIWIMIGFATAFTAILLLPGFLRRRFVALAAVASYAVVYFVCLVVLPVSVQSLVVEPNELQQEKPFLRHNIALTREAFQLDQVEERSYSALHEIGPAAIDRNKETIDNIRLWDWRPLSVTFRQLQRMRAYYEFSDVDVDRYHIGTTYRQVMLATRELAETLPDKAETWLNQRLQYTHGYGIAMSLTAEKTKQGGPVFIIKDLPPRSDAGLSVTQAGIYYGEGMSDYRIVSTSVPEFDYPQGDENVYSTYDGRGGVTLDSFWKKLLFAWHQFDASIVLTSYVGPRSRIQFWRGVRERVQRLAPFLRLDDDPYPVLISGRLYWIQDAYTVSSMFPYSEPYSREINYIRNSVKVVVDAYDGDVVFYMTDPDDPILRTYRKAMPGLISPFEAMPEDLRRHLRYPQDLFEAQVVMYSTYHMTVPQVFYNGEDLWAAPREKYGGEVITMKPYYVLMKLPGEAELQYLLMTPLTPTNRANMVAWMAARCDYPDYGVLLVYKLPKDRLVLGPMQVEATIDQDTLISQQLSLWDQRGSRVVRGNLLVIPIDQSFLYVEPVYLIAEDNDIPQLQRIIVSDGERLAMEPTLGEALVSAFGVASGELGSARSDKGADRLSEVREALLTAEQALRDGDWGRFGNALQELKQLLDIDIPPGSQPRDQR